MQSSFRRFHFASLVHALWLTFATSLESMAAKIEKPRGTIQLVSSPERGVSLRRPERPTITISNFKRSEARKFLLMSLGPEVFDKRYASGSSFFGTIPDDGCKVENTLLARSLPYEAKNASFGDQTRALHTCIVTRVVNAAGEPLRIPEGQPGCKVESLISPWEALLSGGYCHVGVGIESLFYVTYELREECRSQAFHDLQGLKPRDFFAFAGFFISGDVDGQSLDLSPLDSVSLRYTQEPPSAAMPLSINLGPTEPRYPSRVDVEVDMGGLRVLDLGEQGTALEGSFHVINACEPLCARGKCASPCDFPAALGSTLTLYDRTNKQPVHVAYTGAVAPATWEGLMPFQTKVPPQVLVPGHKYSLEADFSYPDQFYNIFKQGFSQFLIDVGDVSNLAGQAGYGSLPVLRPMSALSRSLPDMPLFPPLGGLLNGNSISVGGALDSLNRLIKFSGWPPYYESLCKGAKCVNISKAQNKYKVGVEFELAEFAQGEGKLKGVVMSRTSNLRGDARKAFTDPPRVVCQQSPGPF